MACALTSTQLRRSRKLEGVALQLGCVMKQLAVECYLLLGCHVACVCAVDMFVRARQVL